jgi:hypothetical protein
MGILAHRPIQEPYDRPKALQLFNEQHLVDVVPRKPIRSGDQNPLHGARRDQIA